MRILFLAAILGLTACGGSGETAAPVDTIRAGRAAIQATECEADHTRL